MKKSPISALVSICIIFFLYLPILILFISSFDSSKYGSDTFHFSFKWYIKLFQERELWRALLNSLIIGIGAALVSCLLGTLSAFSLFRFKTFLQKVHHAFVYVPLIIPDILMGISLLLFFGTIFFPLGLFTVFIAHTTFCISYVAMVVLSRLQHFDFSVIEAAQDLGANGWLIVKKVWLPLLAPSMFAGGLLAFTLSFDDFVITYFVAGQGALTLPLYIYSMIKFGSTPIINALSTLLLLLTGPIVWLTHTLSEDV
ncbi:Spermidine/putrescine transport system permease protein PotC [Chlamydiales bacterium STE3]|nr:Spermidine/putrescine transport system permease protein PotC [Chlamydiales bacterium STE3]